MLLSKLEIKGFKSFGDKITIQFDQGITGIVGPNGCGKSNIVDAIRWVLGEQKIKNLRSEKMENVIFNGSKHRKPLQMAEVSLTFENNRGLLPTEYAQVTVTRRYYRTGESEYQLNGVTCRLKDITDLFLDTGIGSDSYAIIELKMVDELLNDKENSRRTLFEEAAGISKFKIRKKQALRKLEETDADLQRVEDLLFEINKNMKSLERQAKQAERYQVLKAEYKQLSMEFAKLSIAELQNNLGNNQHHLEEQARQKQELAEQATALDLEVNQLRESITREEEHLQKRQQHFNAHFAQIKQLETEQRLQQQQLQHTTDKTASLQRNIEEDERVIRQSEQEIITLEEQGSTLNTQLAEAENILNELKEEVAHAQQTRAGFQENAQQAAQRARQQQQELYQHSKAVDVKKAQLQNVQQELERITRQQQLHLDQAVDYTALKARLNAELETKNQELHALHEQDLQHRTELEQAEQRLTQTREDLTQHNRHLDAQRNQLQLTRSMVESLEGFPEAIKFLNKNPNWQPPAPLLSDLIQCDARYRKAVESFLEPYLSFYVVDTPGQALAGIELLQKGNKGRASFIVLEEVNALDLPATPGSAEGMVSVISLITTEPRYQALMNYLFHEVYLTENVSDTLTDSLTCVQADGAIVRKPLSLTGGSVGLFTGSRLGRAKNYENLQKEVASLTTRVEELKMQFQEAEQALFALRRVNLREPIRQLEQAIQRLQQEILTANLKEEQQKQTQEASGRRQADVTAEIHRIIDELAALQPRLAEEQQTLLFLEEEASRLQQQLQAHNEALTERSGRYNQANIQFHQLQNKLHSIRQRVDYHQKSLESTVSRVEQNRQALAGTSDQIVTLEEQLAKTTQQLGEKLQLKDELSREIDELQKAFFSLRRQADLTEKQLRDLQHKRQLADELSYQMQQSANDTNLKLVAVRERLSVEFNLTEEDLAEVEITSGLSTDELRAQITSLRSKLDAIGPVNPMALEAYTEVSERNTFIREQRDDLERAKKSLLDTISEINTVARDQYLEAFQKIRENFMQVFRSLFSEEDSCDLIITEPENPLESRIEIIAKPKGKRPLTINQLSGGEKTLTAISLLFAIYLLKPAPFCIFDEVDAPLDDANIDKFNRIIQKFSDESQFIIVTHNKRTMSSTDVIYGITMLEPGVSKVLPVDLRAVA